MAKEHKFKHHKKRNTAFLFEALSREATKAILQKDLKRASFIKKVLVDFFSPLCEMKKELDLYKSLENETVEANIADRFLQEVKNRHSRLDKKKIFNEQTSLIKVINKHLGFSVYDNFVPSYKNIATVSQIFNDKTPIKEKILLEQTVLKNISSEKQKQELKPVDNIVYKSFTNKFNEKYSDLLSEQKTLLTRFVSSFADNGLELKVYLNEEIQRLKEGINTALNVEEIKNDQDLKKKTTEVQEFLKTFKDAKDISKEMLEKVLKIQQFVHEVNK